MEKFNPDQTHKLLTLDEYISLKAKAELLDELEKACDLVNLRLAAICTNGNTMEDFLNSGSMREIDEVLSKAKDLK